MCSIKFNTKLQKKKNHYTNLQPQMTLKITPLPHPLLALKQNDTEQQKRNEQWIRNRTIIPHTPQTTG